MQRSASTDHKATVRNVLERLRGSDDPYPCPEAVFLRLVCEGHPIKPATVKRLISQDEAIVRRKRHSRGNAPYFLAFAEDERLIFTVEEDSIRQVLEKSGKPLSVKEIADTLAWSSEPAAISFLKEQLDFMAESNRIHRQGVKYEAPARARDLDVIQAIGDLKKAFSYPVSVKSVAKKMPPPKITEPQLRKLLDSMTETGAFRKVKIGTSVQYVFDGDDRRYGKKATEALKCELLAEIEDLRTSLAECRQDTVPRGQVEPRQGSLSKDETISGRIMAALDEETRLSGRRTVELRELRRRIPDMPGEMLEQALQDLGSSRVLELKPIQDVTKLTSEQRVSLLKLSDGTMILAVARLTQGS